MKTQRTADIVVGVVIALLGVFVIYAATLITGGAAHQLPPQTFPLVVGVLLLVCGVSLALKAWSVRSEGPAISWPDRQGVVTNVVTLALVGAYILVLGSLGLPLATFLYVALATTYLRPAKWRQALVIGIVSGVLSYYLFIRLLGLSFPAGPFLE